MSIESVRDALKEESRLLNVLHAVAAATTEGYGEGLGSDLNGGWAADLKALKGLNDELASMDAKSLKEALQGELQQLEKFIEVASGDGILTQWWLDFLTDERDFAQKLIADL